MSVSLTKSMLPTIEWIDIQVTGSVQSYHTCGGVAVNG